MSHPPRRRMRNVAWIPGGYVWHLREPVWPTADGAVACLAHATAPVARLDEALACGYIAAASGLAKLPVGARVVLGGGA